MVNGAAAMLEPTFNGYVATTQDALLLFEACLTGDLRHVPRRPCDRERSHLVRSGSVFVYDESSSGIKRWTDGIAWSPSRILGNFLVYRELNKQFPSGEKRRAIKKATRRPVPARWPGKLSSQQDNSQGSSSTSIGSEPCTYRPSHQLELERAFVGSLLDSYSFKDSGLVKKTMSVTVIGVTHHLVSYYTIHDVMCGSLSPPSIVESLRSIRPRNALTQEQNFRYPIDELDAESAVRREEPSQAAAYRSRPPTMAPPTNHMQTPLLDFYLHSAPYANSPPPQLDPFTGSLTCATLADQLALNPYSVNPGPTAIPPTQEAHHSVGARPYGGEMDSMSTHSVLTTSIPGGLTCAYPGSLNCRDVSNSDHSLSAYRNSSVSSCIQATDVPFRLDRSAPGGIPRDSFSMCSQFQNS
ncbi:Gluconate transport inducer 1/Pac2 [Penicillium canescens]|nr:Gluconate transport inducer 1/Pac2 [Penicillium canescens]